ncbi:MAG: metallophosphoesterase [Tannerella sp.]|jgi:predicted MPP superfamily phosphohydrolase|nr:metallophosphoesterase [Tannerella sp.]
MPVFFIVLLVSYLLGNFYVFIRGLQALGQMPAFLKISVSIVFWVCSLLPFAFFLMRNTKSVPFSIGHFVYQFGTGWLIFALYMVIFLALTDLFRVFNHSFSYGFVISLLLTVSLLIYGYINYKHLDKQVFNIHINKPSDNGEKSLKIVAISDWHLGLGSTNKQINSIVEKINAEKPDIILIAGDLIDNSVVPVIAQEMDKDLNRLEAKEGIYMSPGNHEYISGIEACKRFIGKTKITLLMDSVVTLPCGLQIVGRDDRSNHRRMSAGDWKNLVRPSKPVILLDHQPSHLEDAATIGADLQVSGHTHHGQIIPITWLTDRMFDLSYGYEKRENVHYYVSSGVSLWGPPFRIGTHSEILVFHVTFGN